MRIHGIYAPLATPFDHLGRIYWSKLDHNVDQLCRTRLSGLLVGSRWGEGPLLSHQELVRIWKRAAERAGKDVQVLAAISGRGVAVARELVSRAADSGCTAAVLEAPDLGEVAPAAATHELFFRAVADGARLPLLATLSLAGPNAVSVGQVTALARHPCLSGALLEGGEVSDIVGLAKGLGRDFPLVVSDLQSTPRCLAGGAAAALLTIAAAVPFYALSIEEAVRTREQVAAADLVARARELDALLSRYGAPALKCALDLCSAYGGVPRLPLLGLSRRPSEEIVRSLGELAS